MREDAPTAADCDTIEESPPFGTVYQFDADGRIKPTPEGIITPEGVLLIAGKPKLVPPVRPVIAASIATLPAVTETLPAAERAKVIAYVGRVMETDDSWIPDSFKQGMAEAAAGKLVEMETVLVGTEPPLHRS